MILHIYADYDKRIGAYKITYILGRDYGIFISVGRVYRLMHSMQLPPISTIKPKSISRPKELSGCYANHLHQAFHQKAPNLVWTSDFTYLKAGGKWYYLCIIMDLFLEKLSLSSISSGFISLISWNNSPVFALKSATTLLGVLSGIIRFASSAFSISPS